MKDYKKELENYEYDKRDYVRRGHELDFLKDEKEAEKFEEGNHMKRKYEISKDEFKPISELLKPERMVRQSSPEITGQFETGVDPKDSKYVDE